MKKGRSFKKKSSKPFASKGANAARRDFGQVIRKRRRQLDLTREEVARRITTSTPYIGHLESGKRHPSEKVVTKLADVLGLDRRELFFLANPGAKALLAQQTQPSASSAWDEFRKDERLRRIHNISAEEMKMLSGVHDCWGWTSRASVRDYIYILNTIRRALG